MVQQAHTHVPEQEAPPPPPVDKSLSAGFKRWAYSISDYAGALFNLATLEARLAALSMTEMIALGIATALLAVCSWLALLGVLTIGLINLGVPLYGSLLIVAGLNILLATLAVFKILKLSDNLKFKATSQMLNPRTGSANEESYARESKSN